MSDTDPIRHHLHRALLTLSEGWHALRQRAPRAVTHFAIAQRGEETQTAETLLAREAARWAVLPAELREDEENLVLHLEIPGMDPDRFEIEILDDHLVVRGEKRVDAEQCGGRYFLLERAYGFFERSFHLPAQVDRTGVRAAYQRGVLTVFLPKTASHRPHRIPVTTG
ncbi:MAG TPA: Hsp20/alpha crystallin family protein [Methylococcus sp.]|nr:Hsp20/alpha crystallin family protein [Methylococcus sp.]